MSWQETTSPNFQARHDERDADAVVGVLEQLEAARERLERWFSPLPDGIAVILHPSPGQLALAQPAEPLLRRLTTPAARRYVAGWFTAREVHVLAPRLLAERASNVPGSREMLALTPAALYAQLVVGLANPGLPPPFRPRSALRQARWAWLSAGAGQWFSGQTAHARPAIGRRLREGGEPRFPPGLRDAQLLGGSVLDLLVREEGEAAAAALAIADLHDPRELLEHAFRGRSFVHTAGAWRAHLARMAGA
jgi:hypothetical protein